MNEHPGTFHRAFGISEVKAVNEEENEVLHVISTPQEDRAGDIVDPMGAQVDNFMKNPQVLADHDYSIRSIIGNATSVKLDKSGIWARTKFQTITDIGRDAFALVKGGFAKAWSIGFRPVKWDSIKDEKGVVRGFRFKQWELLEYSLVTIPMNPEVTMSLGLSDAGRRYLLSVTEPPEAEPEVPARESAKAEPEVVEVDPKEQRAVMRALEMLDRNQEGMRLLDELSKRGL